METDAPFPVLTLRLAEWRAEVFDPRAQPMAMGTRYVHGGWVRQWWRGGRPLTGRVRPLWNPDEGEGLPESFEIALGFARALEGEEVLCLGAGRARRQGRRHGDLCQPVAWEVIDQSPSHVAMRCRDALRQDGHLIQYELTRTVTLHEDGLDSATTLHADLLWSHPIQWYPHPFFAHSGPDRTAFQLPPRARVGKGPANLAGPAVLGADGLWRLPPAESLTNFVGLWGYQGPIIVHLDPALGGGRLSVELDCPLDHVVVWANERVASPEPKFIRAWKDGETLSWTLRYRWLA